MFSHFGDASRTKPVMTGFSAGQYRDGGNLKCGNSDFVRLARVLKTTQERAEEAVPIQFLANQRH